MMLETDLRTFAIAAQSPSVSLLLTTSHLDEYAFRLRLREQARTAIERFLAEHGADTAVEIADLLDTTIASAELRDGQHGVAVFVNANLQRVIPLMTDVPDRVVVDATFATRDLVRAEQRSPHYRVVTMSDRATRLFDGAGFALHEVRGVGFPFAIESEGDVRPRRTDRRQALRQYVAQLDAALRPFHTHDPMPLIVVGLEPRLSTVARHSEFRDIIVGTVRARCEYPDPNELASLVGPATDAIVHAGIEQATRELSEAPGDRVALGITDAWQLANHGRGDLLVVEESFTYPARIDPASNQPVPAMDPDAPGVVDDLVDETIEVVLAKRGRCAVVPDGTLPTGAGVAMKLRY